MPIYNAQILKIDAKETRRYAGLNRAEKFDEKNIIDACDEALLLIDVKGVWKIYDYDCESHTIISEPNFKIEGNSIIKHLAGCEKVACIAVTVGEKIEREVTNKFRQGQYVLSMLLDAAATSAVEQAADSLEKAIEEKVSRESYKMKSRYSPGYGDWSLFAQKNFFPLTGAKEIGMNLSTAMMLMPRKSVTAVIGLQKIIGGEEKIFSKNHSCASCDKLDCISRVG